MKKDKKKKPVMTLSDHLSEGDNLQKELEAQKKLQESGKADASKFARVVSLDDLLESGDVRYVTLENIASALIDLKVKSKDGKTSFRRAKVYFSAHPSDFDAYFESLTDVLLKQLNCDIYYLEKDCEAEDGKALGMRISEMSLVIFPVTENFLSGQNRSIDCEVRAAIDYGVPILPILAGGDVRDFNEKVGSYEAVDLHGADFEGRLKKYLDDTLFYGAESERIHREFAARIFLSYRKKDIAYARRLIGMLRRSPLLRDVSIWYDNYLTVGEDYNEEISEAIRECDLFALLVTPNLVNESNYVLQIEYPAALECGKTVFAVGACPTDRAALGEMYRGNYPFFLSEEEEGILEFIKEHLEEKIGGIQDTAEHKYHMGTAYYAGVEVDIDRPLGVRLLSESAEEGYVPAVAKLMCIRRYVPDLIQADDLIRWAENAIKALTAGGKISDPESYELIADGLVSQYITGYRTEKAEKLIRHMVDSVGGISAHKAELLIKYARLYFRLASALEIQDDVKSAEQYADLAYETIEKVLRMDRADFPNELYYRILGTVARIGEKCGNTRKAIEAGEKARARFARADITDEDEKTAYAQFAVNYIPILSQTGKVNDALGFAFEVEKILTSLPGDDIVIDTLALLYETVGYIYYSAARGDGKLVGMGLQYFNMAVNKVAEMSDDNPPGKALRLAQYILNFGNALSQYDINDDAIRALGDVIGLCKRYAFDARRRYLFLKTAVKNLTIVLVSEQRYEEAVARYDDFLKMADSGQLNWADPSYECADFSYRAAYILICFLGDRERGRLYLEGALAHLKAVPADGNAKELRDRIMELAEGE